MNVTLNNGEIDDDYSFTSLAKEIQDYLNQCVSRKLDDGVELIGHESSATVATLVAEKVEKDVRGFPFCNEALLAAGVDDYLKKMLTKEWKREKSFYSFKMKNYTPIYHR